MINWVNVNGSSPNLVCALILWRRAGLGMLIGQFFQFLIVYDRIICLPHDYSFKDCGFQLLWFTRICLSLVLSKLGKIFCRQYIEIFFLIFPEKIGFYITCKLCPVDLGLHCLLRHGCSNINPFEFGNIQTGNWRTVQTQIRCRRMWHLIRVSSVCK